MPISVESEKCTGCRLCILACPDPNVICFNSKKKIVNIDPDRCKVCKLCIETCPEKAIGLAEV